MEAVEPEGRAGKRERTRRELTVQARRLTAEHGVSGFTIEELCRLVGVSRRTFFNYFPTKEDAIVGTHDDLADEIRQRFLDARPAGIRGISPTLMDDLATLAIGHAEHMGNTPEQARGFATAVEREPRLLQAFMRTGTEREAQLAELVAQREGLEPGDPTARLAVLLMGSLLRTCVEEFLSSGNTLPFTDIMRDRLARARHLLTI